MKQEKVYPWQPDIPDGYVRFYTDHTCRWYEDISEKKLEKEKKEREREQFWFIVPLSKNLNKKKRRHNQKPLRKRQRAVKKRFAVELSNILTEEIQKEINKEIIAKINSVRND